MYYELAVGSPSNRGIIVSREEIAKYIKYCQKNGFELYKSIYCYDEDIKKHMENYKTVRSFTGNLYIEDIILDIDIKTDTDEYVLERAREFYHKLVNTFDLQQYDLIVYYSGRGYHFKFPDYFNFLPSSDLHREVKATVKELFPEVDCSIYIKTGIIRVANTINRKVDRYKIPLYISEFLELSAEDIKNLSKSIREDFNIDYQKQANLNYSHLKVKVNVERIETHNPDEPTRVITCMQHLFNRGSITGRRHIEGLRLVSAWRVQGLTQTASITLLKQWSPSLNESEIKRIVRDVYDKGYRYGCNDEVMMSFCDPKCIYYKHKNYITDVLTPNHVQDLLYEKVMLMPDAQYLNLKDILLLKHDYMIYEGEMVVIFGDTKIGKSTLVQNIIANTDMKTLYMSLENRIMLDARRLLQIKLNLTKEQVYEKIKENRRLFAENLPHISMIEQTVSINDLYKIVADSDTKIIVIDTLDQLKVPKVTDYTTKTEILANELREFTNDTKVILLAVHHISKHSSVDTDGNFKSMHIHSGKGSSAIEQKADKVISIEGARNNQLRIIKSQGARDENGFEKLAYFDVNTFRLVLEENQLV